MKLSIVIINYKNEQKTIEYVLNELSKVDTKFVTVIVNNSATDNSNNTLVNSLNAVLVTDINTIHTHSSCYIISHADNLGFAKGNNLGVDFINKHFKSEYIVFSNNDIRIIDKTIFEKLIYKMDTIKNIGMIGPNCIGEDGKSQSPRPYLSFWTLYILRFWLTPFISKQKKENLLQLNYAIHAKEGDSYKLSGSFFMVRNTDFISCGMMDPYTFLYCEEEILTERLFAINKRVYYYPDVTVLHEHSQTISKFYDKKRIITMAFKSHSYYYKKYKGVTAIAILFGKINLYFFTNLKILFGRNLD